MFLNFYNVAVLLSTKQCLNSIVSGFISKGVSFTLSITCRLLYYLMELAILLLKFNLGNNFMEACYRCFVAPHKYFNGVVIVCVEAHRLSACACMQLGSIHVTFSELCFSNA